MPNTPKGLTYPSSSSPVAVPADIQELATDVDGLIVPNTGGTYTGSVSFTQSPSVPTPTSGLHAVNKTYADAINTDVTAIETELGTNPSGTFSTVVQRLDSYTDGFNKVGNLLSENQASGGDTLGNTTGFVDSGHETTRIYITSDSKNGAGCIKTTLVGASSPLTGLSGAFACTPGETVTFLVALKVAATSGKVRANLMFRLADDSYVYVEGANLTGSAWGWATVTSVAPATAVSVYAYVFAYDFAPGEYYLLDSPSIHKGVGGSFQLPGVPIPGQGAIKANGAVELPGGDSSPEGTVTANPGSTFLQTSGAATVTGMLSWRKATGTGNTGWVAEGALADTGWRDVSASASGLTGTGISARVRRVGSTVSYRLSYSQSGAASGVTVLDTAGFLATAPSTFTPAYSNNAGAVDGCVETSASLVRVYTTTAANGGTWTTSLTWATSDAWPSSLPGSAV